MEKTLYCEQINKRLEILKGDMLLKIEFEGDINLISLTFKTSVRNNFNVLKLMNCYAFKDLGIFNDYIDLVLIKDVGHYFREYCIKKGIDYQHCYQLEIYPKNFKDTIDEELHYKTFFAICDNVEVFTLSEEISF